MFLDSAPPHSWWSHYLIEIANDWGRPVNVSVYSNNPKHSRSAQRDKSGISLLPDNAWEFETWWLVERVKVVVGRVLARKCMSPVFLSWKDAKTEELFLKIQVGSGVLHFWPDTAGLNDERLYSEIVETVNDELITNLRIHDLWEFKEWIPTVWRMNPDGIMQQVPDYKTIWNPFDPDVREQYMQLVPCITLATIKLKHSNTPWLYEWKYSYGPKWQRFWRKDIRRDVLLSDPEEYLEPLSELREKQGFRMVVIRRWKES
jgi:hypothetical protein